MTTTETDILALVEHVRQARSALEAAQRAAKAARETARAADDIAAEADTAFRLAENALVVSAGGTDRSWQIREYVPLWDPVAAK